MHAFKTTLAAALLAALGTSGPQAADVEAYGTLDMYLAVNNDSGNWTSGVQSGGASASLVGLKGAEKLSDGLSALFKLEAGVLMDDGTSAPPGGGSGYLFQRESWVGLSSDAYGTLTFGRQYTPFFMTFIMIDPGNMSLGSAIGNYCWPATDGLLGGVYGHSDISRRDNAVKYVSPVFNGLSFEFMGSFGEERIDGNASSTLKNAYDAGMQYAAGPLFLRTSLLSDGVTDGEGRRSDRYWVLGAAWHGEVTTPSAIFVRKFSNDTEASPDVWALQLAAATPMCGGNLLTSVAVLKNMSQSDADSLSAGVRYDYPLSKRTKVYAGLSTVVNEDKSSHVVIPGPGSSAPFEAESAGNGARQFFVGMNMSF